MRDQIEVVGDLLEIMRNLIKGQRLLGEMILRLAEKSEKHDERLKSMAIQVEKYNEMVESLAGSIFSKKQN